MNPALRRHAVPMLLLAAAVAALYGRTIGYGFVQYDDHELIVLHYGELVRADNLAQVFWRDPFAVAERFPPDWQARGPLERLEWPDEPPPRRLVEATQQVLKNGDSPTLLGGVQALVDYLRDFEKRYG